MSQIAPFATYIDRSKLKGGDGDDFINRRMHINHTKGGVYDVTYFTTGSGLILYNVKPGMPRPKEELFAYDYLAARNYIEKPIPKKTTCVSWKPNANLGVVCFTCFTFMGVNRLCNYLINIRYNAQ